MMTLKEKMAQGMCLSGTYAALTDATVTEIISYLGYDYIWLDMEHTQLNAEHIYHHIMAAKAGGTPVLVRVPADDLTTTKRVMEMGVDGIIFPQVRDAEHAKELLSYTLYPPYGKRGYGPRGAVKYGIASEPDYYGEGHLNVIRIVQIELESAAEDADNIAALPYLDGCMLGMYDLSGSINRLGDLYNEKNVELAEKAIAAFKRHNKGVGVAIGATDYDTIKWYHDRGVNMITAGADFTFIVDGAKKTLETMKKVQGE